MNRLIYLRLMPDSYMVDDGYFLTRLQLKWDMWIWLPDRLKLYQPLRIPWMLQAPVKDEILITPE